MVFGQRKPNKTNTDFRNIIILTIMFSAVIITIGITKTNGIWGSETDWISQHFAVPEYFRTRFYRTGDLFPDFAFQLGAGQNIYNFAYYGLMNPVYLPSYLLPQVRMSDYIQIISIISVYFSCTACYCLLKRHFSRNISLILSIIFMCSAPLVFHSHRHIMFINYLPFQLMAMICAGNEDTLKNRAKIIFCSYSVMCTSFYFSIGAFASLIIYAVFIQLKQFRSISLRKLRPTIICMVSGIITAGILWIPTFFTLIKGRESSSSSSHLTEIFFPKVSLQYLLYGPYSMGLTFIAVISVITMLRNGDKAMRFLSAVFALFACCPLLVYILNGTMYLDAKVLIPFLPLMMIVTGGFLERLFSMKINIYETTVISVIVISADILMNYRSVSKNLILTADALITITAIIIFVRTQKKQAVLIPLTVLSLINCFTVNFHDSYVTEQSVEVLYSEDIQKLVDKTVASDGDFYRFADGSGNGQAVNRIYGENYYTTNIYSSVSNSYYRNFRFKNSENSHRNNALQTQPKNIIFNTLMGCRYRIGRSSQAMAGETVVDNENEYILLKNKNALPVGYACSDVMNESDWKKLSPAQQSEAMLENIIIPSGSSSAVLPSHCSELNTDFTLYGDTDYIKQTNSVYEVKSKIPFSITAKPETPIKDKIIFIEFHADNRIGKKSERSDISVSINGVKNTLSDPEWKYNNMNYNFTYVISSDSPIEELEFNFSAGNYILSDFNICTLDTQVLENAGSNKDCFMIDREKNGGDVIQGNIDVTKDGWFSLSVPYDDGFEILVDGVKTDYFRTNTAFTGFPIKKGKHFITLNYKVPYRSAGILMTISGIGMSTYLILCQHISRRRKIYRIAEHVTINRKGKLT